MNRLLDNKSIHILLFSFDWRNLYEVNTKEIIEKFERDGVNPEHNKIFSLNWSIKSYHKEISENLQTTHLKARVGKLRVLYDIANIFMTPLLLEKYAFKPNIVLLYDFPSIFGSLYPRLFLGCKVVIILTNLPTKLISTRKYRLWPLVYQRLMEFLGKHIIHQVFAINETTAQYAKEIGFKPSQIKIFNPNTITRDQKHIETSRKNTIREMYHIPKDKKIILSVGRLEPEKNFDGLIGALKKINDGDLILMIVGQGSLEDRLKKLVADLSLEKSVFFAGNIDRQNIWDFYRDADAFILLSDSEGLGLVFWEAMYMNVPVLGSRVGGIVETIGEDGDRGFFWEETDGIEKLRSKVKACVDKSEAVKSMVVRAHTYVEKKMSTKSTTINDLLNEK